MSLTRRTRPAGGERGEGGAVWAGVSFQLVKLILILYRRYTLRTVLYALAKPRAQALGSRPPTMGVLCSHNGAISEKLFP